LIPHGFNFNGPAFRRTRQNVFAQESGFRRPASARVGGWVR
jgi:hypothetical protein